MMSLLYFFTSGATVFRGSLTETRREDLRASGYTLKNPEGQMSEKERKECRACILCTLTIHNKPVRATSFTVDKYKLVILAQILASLKILHLH